MDKHKEDALRIRLLAAFHGMKEGDIRDMVAYAEASARENPRAQPLLQLVVVGFKAT